MIKLFKKMKRFIKIVCFAVFSLYCSSCREYLEIVPDNTVTIEDYFATKEMAWNALSKVYSYLPNDPYTHYTFWTLGDDWMGNIEWSDNTNNTYAIRIARGLQNSNDPLLGLWNGSNGGKHLYQGIRNANIFLDYIGTVSDMTEQEKTEWKAQVEFLKAYYHFLLLRHYGPIVIADRTLPLDAMSDDLFQKRSKVEDCFDYIIALMNKAILNLKERVNANDLGQVDKVAALAIKARVMLFRASPFWNGNDEYYGDFRDFDGEPFFPLEYKHEKWKDAVDAIEEAIKLCMDNGIDLFEYDKAPYLYDRADYNLNNKMKTYYDLRMLIVDPWNKELIWGQTYDYNGGDNTLASGSNIRLPAAYGEGNASVNNGNYSRQSMGASYKMLERYYTKNGLPIDEDLTFDRNTMYNITRVPGVEEPEYAPIRGLMQPGGDAIKLYMDRELRFYANLGITGGYWRSHTVRINAMMYADAEGGRSATNQNEYLCTGIGVQKFVHPESKSGESQRLVRCPYPIIRMADLYLMKAEALNEYLEGPNEEVYNAINKVRFRAGLPTVQSTWSNAEVVRPEFLNKHLDYEGMKEIILRERSIELAFEGSRFWDMHRHRNAMTEFSSPIMGWDYTGGSARTFFVLGIKEMRRFVFRDYLWPLSLSEINKNANLIQNPGW
jgi:hypothetical protein